MFGFLRKRLGYKIMAAMIITVLLVMVAEIYMRIYFGTKDRFEIVAMVERGVINSIYAGIRHPMAVGDAEGIKRELSAIREKTVDVEVFICDPNQEVIYSTHEDKLRTRLTDSISNSATLETITETLKTGIEPFGPRKLLEDEIAGKRYFVFILPIHNEKDCYHCHGSSRKILGGIVVRTDGERVYSQVAAQRNRTIMIAIFTIPLVAIFVYLMVSKLVRRPVESLAEKAKRFAEGDTSVSADVKTEDEIGILGNTFNYMVESVSAASKKLELEVTRKTALLDERTKLMVLLERANRELRELDKLKSTFLANMSHELRTPMNAIIGYTDLLLDKVDGPVNEEQEKSLKKVVANARHLLQLRNDILDVSKIESGRIEIEPKELDLKWIIESVIPTFEPLIKQKGLTLIINLDENLSTVYGDEDKVKQVFINLLSNAVKFTHQGGVNLSAKLSERGIKPGESPKFAEICVEDTGIGIKDENLGKIFDKFTQVDVSAIRQYEGTGLGLSITRGLIALHKGMIWVTSKYGEGSRFCFTLPLKKEILEKPAEPVLEPSMAEGLAEYFRKPVETFLKEPQYAGKPIRCWEYVRCGQPSCPAYGGKESRCWLILGTHCAGMKIAAYPEKVDFCKGCEIIRSLIVEPEEYKLGEVESLKGEGGAKKTILAIDDNPEAIDIIRKYLGDDYRVIGYLSGEGAVEKVREIKPMAITLDIMMPKKDGWQVLRELKETPETQDIPVIILSIVDNKRLGFSLGAAEYLVKPLEKQVLLRKLRNLEKTTTIKKVLIVDNEPDTVELIGNVLREAGYQIAIAYNSKDAIKTIQVFVPDLIVLNVTMAEVSGFDVIEYLKTEEGVKDTPLIIITHKDLTEKEVDELNGRIHGILNKGVLTEEDLLKEIKDTISKVSNA
ncbi:MAG: response regulator [Nitrospirota bacterium]|nr:response regulator [Nitrospirota bacterium]